MKIVSWRIYPTHAHTPGIPISPPVAGIGDGDNSLSMRWVKLDSTDSMNRVDGAEGQVLRCIWLDPRQGGLTAVPCTPIW
ncbi:hypothetical protein BK654_08020 [Pseudomonas brassicacearum]|nr:hypothetical protein BK654_08020 [Pseudomonas brassicacearum]